MKVTINFDCTAEEARTFLGLPDVSPLNEKYVQATLNTMEGATNLEQMDKLLRSFSPLGEAGMRLFGQMMNMGAAGPRTDKPDTYTQAYAIRRFLPFLPYLVAFLQLGRTS